MTGGNFRGGQLFAGQLFAGLLWGPLAPSELPEPTTAGRGVRMRRWRPAELEPLTLPPSKRPRRRRREELFVIAS